MCLAIPGKIISIRGTCAEVDVMGVLTTVNILLIDNPAIDDHVLIHAGCALQKINAEHSINLQGLLKDFVSEDNENGY